MCYSTCSLNPIEDEAVVAALLRRAEAAAAGAVVLEAWPREVLPQLRRRAGVCSWRVAEHIECAAAAPAAPAAPATHSASGRGAKRKGAAGAGRAALAYHSSSDEEEGGEAGGEDEEVRLRWHRSHAEAAAHEMPHAVPSLWPPPRAEAERLGLERCSRLLPHDQNTGGFFVALLRKRAPLARPADGAAVNGGADGAAAALPASGPASCRQLPELASADSMLPLPHAEADALGAGLGLKKGVGRRRLLRRPGGTGPAAEVHVAPAALSGFAPGALSVASAGLPFREHAGH